MNTSSALTTQSLHYTFTSSINKPFNQSDFILTHNFVGNERIISDEDGASEGLVTTNTSKGTAKDSSQCTYKPKRMVATDFEELINKKSERDGVSEAQKETCKCLCGSTSKEPTQGTVTVSVYDTVIIPNKTYDWQILQVSDDSGSSFYAVRGFILAGEVYTVDGEFTPFEVIPSYYKGVNGRYNLCYVKVSNGKIIC